jgi:hypothetical protein
MYGCLPRRKTFSRERSTQPGNCGGTRTLPPDQSNVARAKRTALYEHREADALFALCGLTQGYQTFLQRFSIK